MPLFSCWRPGSRCSCPSGRSGAAANITLLSYVDEAHLGISTNPAAIPDPDAFLAHLQEGFDEVLKVSG